MTCNEVVEFIRERVADAMEPEEVSWWHLWTAKKQSKNQPINQSTKQQTNQSINQSINRCISFST